MQALKRGAIAFKTRLGRAVASRLDRVAVCRLVLGAASPLDQGEGFLSDLVVASPLDQEGGSRLPPGGGLGPDDSYEFPHEEPSPP